MQWSEGGTNLVVNYRFVTRPDGLGTIERYACTFNGVATRSRMTAPLRTIPVGVSLQPSGLPAPVDIELYGTSGARPGPAVRDRGARRRRRDHGSSLALDAETSNVPTTLSPTTTVVATSTTTTTLAPNLAPVAADLFVQVRLDQALTGLTVPATDGDGDPLTATLVTADPQLAVAVGPSDLSFSTEALSANGATDGATYSFTYTASDGTSTSNVGTVTVRVDSGGTPGTTTTRRPRPRRRPPPCPAPRA